MFSLASKLVVVAFLAGTFVFSACGTEQSTRIIVVVQTDVPTQINRIQLNAQNLLSGAFETGDIIQPEWNGAGCGSFIVAAREGLERAELSIELIATGPSTMITREIRTKFTPNVNQALYIELPKSCDGISCSPSNTCTENGCESSQISTDVLREVELGAEFAAFTKCSP
ncbi:MAG: hypothetical protein VYC39_16015 [Myxococcota bacterium]|nr:hypothetical protein [Myxococcota bacterium]